MDIRIANKYRLGRKIGNGSFGDIYLGKIFLRFYDETYFIFKKDLTGIKKLFCGIILLF